MNKQKMEDIKTSLELALAEIMNNVSVPIRAVDNVGKALQSIKDALEQIDESLKKESWD